MKCRVCRLPISADVSYELTLISTASDRYHRELGNPNPQDYFGFFYVAADLRNVAISLAARALGLHGYCAQDLVGQFAGIALIAKAEVKP